MNHAVIDLKNIDKMYKLYNKPIDRLKEAIGIKKNFYKEYYALKDISLEIFKGETLGIIGTNGSGKSTLLKIITGILNPTSGEVKVNGKISALLELGAGFNPEYTGIENIYLNGTMMGYSKQEIEGKVDKIIEFADIGDFIYQPVKTYSSGMFVRLAFAVAINVDPDILIVDEALSVGDAAFSLKCMDKMREFIETDKTVIFVTHDMQTIKNFCSRAIWIDKGNVIMDGEVSSVVDKYTQFLFEGNIAPKIEIQNTAAQHEVKSQIMRLNSDYHNRWGDKSIEIIGVQMKNEKNMVIDTFKWGEDVQVEIEAIAYQDYINKNIGVGFAFRNNKSIDITTVTSLEDKGPLKNIKKGQKIVVKTWLKNLLAPGDYSLVINIEERDEEVPRYIDFIEGALMFKVIGEGKFFSLIKQETKQEIEVI